jgi:hypothetical protein
LRTLFGDSLSFTRSKYISSIWMGARACGRTLPSFVLIFTIARAYPPAVVASFSVSNPPFVTRRRVPVPGSILI